MRSTLVLTVGLFIWGCGDDAVVAGGGTSVDVGTPMTDSGSADARPGDSAMPDATGPVVDAAGTPMDGGPDLGTPSDSGAENDSGADLDSAVADAGRQMGDAAPVVDSATVDAARECGGDDACGPRQNCDPDGRCVCSIGFTGDACDACSEGYIGYPDCRVDPCVGVQCDAEAQCDPADGQCVACVADADCPAESPRCEPAGRVCIGCLADVDCGPDAPFCDAGRCAECRAGGVAPDGLCQGGICGANGTAECLEGAWTCTAPGYRAGPDVCDHWDTDCDGRTDEDCEAPVINFERIESELEASMHFFDITPDGTTYLSALRGGIGFVTKIPADPNEEVTRLLGNTTDNHGDVEFNPVTGDLVLLANGPDLDPGGGLKIYQDCAPLDLDCGCAGRINCPGFSYEPVVRAAYDRIYGVSTGSPSGVEVAPDGSYYLSQFDYQECVDDDAATDCGPDAPDTWCTEAAPVRCGEEGYGQLAHLVMPDDGPVRWQIIAEFPGREITSMALGRNGDLVLGIYGSGQDPRARIVYFDPRTRRQIPLRDVRYPVVDVANDPTDGSWYAAEFLVDSNPRMLSFYRFAADGRVIDLPDAWVVPRNSSHIHMKFGPDGRMYRLIAARGETTLDALDLH